MQIVRLLEKKKKQQAAFIDNINILEERAYGYHVPVSREPTKKK